MLSRRDLLPRLAVVGRILAPAGEPPLDLAPRTC